MSSNDGLIRTGSGLNNQHLFYGVDLVVYAEGGEEFDSVASAIENGRDDTHDASFWRAMFSTVRPEKHVYIKSVGCRSIANDIALICRRENVSTVCVCTDADFDHYGKPYGPFVGTVQTYGYSWEADLIDPEVIKCVFTRLRGTSARARAEMTDLLLWRNSFLADCKVHVPMDFRRVLSGNAAVFDRANPARNLVFSAGVCPKLDEGYIGARSAAALWPGTSLPPSPESEPNCERHCFGKLVLRAIYHAVAHFIHRVRRGKIDFDTFVDLAISCLSDNLKSTPDRFAYYNDVLPA